MADTKRRCGNVSKPKAKHKTYKIKFEKKFIVICSVAVSIFAILAVYLVLSNLDSLTIKTISVIGNKHYSHDEIVKCLNIYDEQNILKFSQSHAEQSVRLLPYVNKVNITKKLPNQIVVRIDEREPAYIAYVKGNNIYVLLDKKGVILSEITLNERNEELLIFGLNFDDNIIYGESITDLEKDKLNKFLSVYEIYMTNSVGKDITSVTLSQSTVVLTLNNELDIKIAYSSDISYKISLLKSILKHVDGKTGSIDMTTDDPIYSVY